MNTFHNTCDVVIEGGLVALLVFSPVCFGAVHPIAFSVLQAAVFVLAFVWVLKVGLHESSKTEPRRIRLVEWCIAAFVIYGLLQWVSVGLFLPGTVCRYATRVALCKFLTYAVAFLLVVANLGEPARLRRLTVAILCMGTLIALLGIAQTITSVNLIQRGWGFEEGARPFGPYVSNDPFAGYMILAIPLALCVVIAQRRERQGGGKRSKIALPCAAAVVMLLALLLCGSAEGIMAFLATCLFLLGLFLLGKGRNAKAKIVFGMAGVILLIVLWWVLAPMIVDDAVIGKEKSAVWQSTVRMWTDSPVWGSGAGTFANAFPMYKDASLGPATIADASSELFQTLAEVGVVGLVIALVFFGTWWVRCIRAWRSSEDTRVQWMIAGGMASVAGMLAFGLLNSCLRVPANAFTFAIVLGISYSLAESAPGPKPEEQGQPEEE